MSGQLKIPSLGRPFSLGMLYSYHSENCIPGKTLWDLEVLESKKQTIPQPGTKFSVSAENTLLGKSSSFNIGGSLKLSFLSGMIEVGGAAEYLNDNRSSESQARVTLQYSSTTRFEQLTMEQLGAIQYPKVLDDNYATHVVTGIIYGFDAFFVFDRSVSKSEKLHDVCGKMEALIKVIPIEGSASLSLEDKSETEKFHCKFYGDLNPTSTPSTFDEAVKFYRDLPQTLNITGGGICVPKLIYLHPLSQLEERPQKIVRSISSNLVSQVEIIIESYHTMDIRGNDLKKHETCSKFVHIESQIGTFLALIQQFKMDFTTKLSDLLPKIRGAGAGAKEKELADLILFVYESPFSLKEMEKYLQRKDKEIKQLTQTLKNMEKVSNIKFDFPSTSYDLIALTTDDQIKYVVCFAFNVTSETSAYIETLKSFLSSATERSDKIVNKDVLKILRSKSSSFIEFAQANAGTETAVFAVTDCIEEDCIKDTDESGPVVILYTEGVPENFQPPGKPGTPEASQIKIKSIDLTWSKPNLGADLVTSYKVTMVVLLPTGEHCHTVDFHTPNAESKLCIKSLSPNTEYQFQVQAVNQVGVSIKSEICSFKTKPNHRPANRFLGLSKVLERKEGESTMYRLPLHEISKNTRDQIFKYRVGDESKKTKPERVLIMVGATGAGKSTLVNGIANFVLGVEWEDDFRFKVVTDEGTLSQAHSQTKNVTAYTFCDTILPYNLTIIDTPGFGDTGGIENDKRIVKQIKSLFSDQDGIDQLHGIGFVTQASLGRLTAIQRYIFDAVLSMYGRDIVDNIFLMVTFSDAGKPQVLEAARGAKIPFQEFFKFNNSALFVSVRSDEAYFNSRFWKMGNLSFEHFFRHFTHTEAKSLALTKEVLKEREHLETLIPGLQQQVDIVLSQLDIIQQKEQVIKQHEEDIVANKDFNYEIEETKFKKVQLKPGIHTTTCRICNMTCHLHCKIPADENKAGCLAMKGGNCTVCPLHCHWKEHSNVPYLFEYYTERVTRTYDHQKEHYETAKTGKEKAAAMLAKNRQKFDELQIQGYSLIELVQRSNERLAEIALKPNPLTELDYIDLLIEAEKREVKSGWKKRVAQYLKMRKNAETLKKSLSKLPKEKSRWWLTFSRLPVVPYY